MDETFGLYVGIDWASAAHEVCVLNAAGEIVDQRSVAHSGDGLADLSSRLSSLAGGSNEDVAVSIEVPHGAVVESLLESGFAVYSINPKQMDRFRDRFSPSGAKDDRRDARVLADSLRTDRHCFRRLASTPADLARLRELVSVDRELTEELKRSSNRLREQLNRYFPQVLSLSSAANKPWVWDLLDRAPTPAAAQGLRKDVITRILLRNRIRKVTADHVVQTLGQKPIQASPASVAAATEHIALLLPRLRLVHSQQADVRKRIHSVLRSLALPADSAPTDPSAGRGEHRDVAILLSLPGVGRVVAATMLASGHRAFIERDYIGFRAQAGLAPVTRSSGKSRKVVMRRACDGHLRDAFYHLARAACISDPASKTYYAALRARGCSHGRATRSVADRLLRILFAMLRDRTLFQPAPSVESVPQAA